jgi:hypothetical protein
LLATFAVTAATFGPARAGQLVVIASTGSELGLGAILDGAKPIELGAGAAVTLVSADGRTLKLKGPYSGPPDPSPRVDGSGLLDALSDIVKPADKDVSTAGIMRASIYAPKDPWVIDSGRSGAQCASAGRAAPLWRAIAVGPASASLKAGARQAPVQWRDGSYTAPWPADIPLRDGASYEIQFTMTKKTERLNLHLIPEGVEGDLRRAVWMHAKGCTPQARALLAQLQ